jgi:hypothetical protein
MPTNPFTELMDHSANDNETVGGWSTTIVVDPRSTVCSQRRRATGRRKPPRSGAKSVGIVDAAVAWF